MNIYSSNYQNIQTLNIQTPPETVFGSPKFTQHTFSGCIWMSTGRFNLAAHRQGYRVTTLHMGKWLGNPITLDLCAAELRYARYKNQILPNNPHIPG